jgi:hypothetical protein
MSNVELAYEVRAHVEFVVASESFMLSRGWDYREVLGQVARNPDISPQELGEAIVRHAAILPGDASISMVKIAESAELTARFKALVDELRKIVADEDERRVLKIVLERTAFLKVRQFLDLRDLCHKLSQEFAGEIANKVDAVLAQLRSTVFHRANGRPLGRLNGLSIFYPFVRARAIRARCDDLEELNAVVRPEGYRKLAFVTDTGWGDLLDALYEG